MRAPIRSKKQDGARKLEARAEATLIMDSTGRLLAMSAAFSEANGIDREESIGQRFPFAWCDDSERDRCSDRLKVLTSLDLSCMSWNCCVRGAGSPEQEIGCDSGADGSEGYVGGGGRCIMQSDPGKLQIVDVDSNATIDRVKDLEAAAHRIGTTLALELEQLGLVTHVLPTAVNPEVCQDLKQLSTREWEVLRLLIDGSRVPKIAKALFISPHTVRNHLHSVYRKVGVKSQAELIDRVKGHSLSVPSVAMG